MYYNKNSLRLWFKTNTRETCYAVEKQKSLGEVERHSSKRVRSNWPQAEGNGRPLMHRSITASNTPSFYTFYICISVWKETKQCVEKRTETHSGSCVATLSLVPVGIAPSAAGGNINPPVGRRLVGACGQQLARQEVGQHSADLCASPGMPSVGPDVCAHL